MLIDRDPLEIFWDAILSRQPELIQAACLQLDDQERKELIAHLRRMATEEGWHPEQRKSAQAALASIPDSLQS